LKRWSVTSVAEENAIRRRICVVSRIRDARYGLVAHRSLAVAAPLATTRLRPIVPEDYGVAGSESLMHRKRLMIDGSIANSAVSDIGYSEWSRFKDRRHKRKCSGTIERRFGKLSRIVKFQLTNHARRAAAEREIPVEWIERTLEAPELIVPDANDPTIERCFRRIVSRSLPLVSTATSRLYRPCRSPHSLHSWIWGTSASSSGEQSSWTEPSGECILRSQNEGQVMRLHVDKEAYALYLRLDDSKIIESEEVAPGVILDYNEKDEVVGVEMLYLSKRTPNLKTTALEFESV
jgi:uncharacterized protein YuzE